LVQPELHAQDEGRESHGDPGQPVPDQAPAGLPEAVAFDRQTLEAAPIEPEGWGFGLSPAAATEPLGLDPTAPTDPAILASAPPGGQAPAVRTAPRSASPSQTWAVIRDEIVAWVKTLGSAAVYATLIVTFGFQVARVEGQSMAPTLQDQDRLIVNKAIYRLSAPRRSDIVMLYYPINPDKSFVKRVIAEESDTVRITDGRVYVNDIPLDDSYVPPEYRSHDDWGPSVIPEGYYFVMGDHRNNSSDSRHWGMVPKKYIIGKVQVRWWPLQQSKLF
jgi:signal peptidase I